MDLGEAATAAGVNAWQLDLAETGGKHDLRFLEVADLASIYNVTMDWLSGRAGVPVSPRCRRNLRRG